jgi:hypothetical protein
LTDVPDETVIAFVDGRLAGEALSAFKASLANDPALADRVSAHRWMTQQIIAAYGSPPDLIADETLAARFGLLDDNVVPIPRRQAFAVRRPVAWASSIGLIAASVIGGMLLGPVISAPESGLFVEKGGQLIAAGPLAAGLSGQMSGQPGPIHIGLSFRTRDGICRTFRSAGNASGIGCRDGANWRVPMMVADGPGPDADTEYRLAAGDVPPSVMAEVDRMIKGAPLSPADEARMKAIGWHWHNPSTTTR